MEVISPAISSFSGCCSPSTSRSSKIRGTPSGRVVDIQTYRKPTLCRHDTLLRLLPKLSSYEVQAKQRIEVLDDTYSPPTHTAHPPHWVSISGRPHPACATPRLLSSAYPPIEKKISSSTWDFEGPYGRPPRSQKRGRALRDPGSDCGVHKQVYTVHTHILLGTEYSYILRYLSR